MIFPWGIQEEDPRTEEEDLQEEDSPEADPQEEDHLSEPTHRSPRENLLGILPWYLTGTERTLKCSLANGTYTGESTTTIPFWQTLTEELCSSSPISKDHLSMNSL